MLMNPVRLSRLVSLAVVAVAAMTAGATTSAARPGKAGPDPWTSAAVITPAKLAKQLGGAPESRPTVLCVGFSFLYRGSHIAGAKFAGPASQPEGITALRQAALALPKDKPVVLYCGCCPWEDCPNIRPAYRAMQALGFRDVRVLMIPTNFHQDWAAQGFPTEKESAR